MTGSGTTVLSAPGEGAPAVRRERLAHHVGATRRASRLRVVAVGDALERVANGGLGGRFEAGVFGANAQIGTLWSPIARTTTPPACPAASLNGVSGPTS